MFNNNGSQPNSSRSVNTYQSYDQQQQPDLIYGSANDMRFNSPRLQYLPAKYVTKIENTSIFEMLDLFFRYFVEVFDVFGDVVSLKERGEVSQSCVCCLCVCVCFEN
jgi:hypothetical protein